MLFPDFSSRGLKQRKSKILKFWSRQSLPSYQIGRNSSVRKDVLCALAQLRKIDNNGKEYIQNRTCHVLKRYGNSFTGSLLHRVLDSPYSDEYTIEFVRIVLDRAPEQAKIRRRFDSALPIHLVFNFRHGHSVEVMRLVHNAYPDAVFVAMNHNHIMVQDFMKYCLIHSSNECRSRTDEILSDSFVSSVSFALDLFPGCSVTVDIIGSLRLLWEMPCYNQQGYCWHSNLSKLTEKIIYSRFIAFHGKGKAKDYQPLHALLSEGRNLFNNTQLREYYFGKYLAECASRVDHHGRSLLVIALEQGYCWEPIIKELYEAFPAFVTVVDPLTGLYPFMIAAQSGVFFKDDKVYLEQRLDTVYSILRRDSFASKMSLQNSATSQWINFLTDENIILRRIARESEALQNENERLKREVALLTERCFSSKNST